jgi:predicted nucleic acid-binding protein
MLRAVLDTNTVISGSLRPGPNSPHRSLLRLGLSGCFQWLISDDILLEYIEKLRELGVSASKVERFAAQLLSLAEPVSSVPSTSATTR